MRGAIETVMSKEYLLKILAIINNNQEKHIIKMVTNEAKNVDYPIEVVTVTDSEEEEEGELRKGTVGSLERRKKMKKVQRRVRDSYHSFNVNTQSILSTTSLLTLRN